MSTSLTLLGVLGLVFYASAVVWAAVAAWKSQTPPTLHPLIRQAITVIGPALATYLGAQLGISVVRDDGVLSLLTPAVKVPVIAMWTYIASLVGSAVVWLLRPNSTPEELRQLAVSLIGVLLGALSIILGLGST